MIQVKATRELRLYEVTASGYVVDLFVPFVALPAVAALHKAIRIRNPLNDRQCVAIVLDVGPWEERDDQYVFDGGRPAAESGLDSRGRRTNGSGIDLSERVWLELAMTDNTPVQWEFIRLPYGVDRPPSTGLASQAHP